MSDETPEASHAMLDSYLGKQTVYLQGGITHADQKATFVLLLIGVLVGYLESRQAFETRMITVVQWRGVDSLIAGVSLAATGLLVLGGWCAGRVVWPRFDSNASGSFAWIATHFAKSEEFAQYLFTRPDKEVLTLQLMLHKYRCGVCLKKWCLLKWAYGFCTAGFALFILHLFLAVIRQLLK